MADPWIRERQVSFDEFQKHSFERMVITGTNFKFAPIFDWLMALFRNHEYMWNAIFDEFLA